MNKKILNVMGKIAFHTSEGVIKINPDFAGLLYFTAVSENVDKEQLFEARLAACGFTGKTVSAMWSLINEELDNCRDALGINEESVPSPAKIESSGILRRGFGGTKMSSGLKKTPEIAGEIKRPVTFG